MALPKYRMKDQHSQDDNERHVRSPRYERPHGSMARKLARQMAELNEQAEQEVRPYKRYKDGD